MKIRVKSEASFELSTICRQLKMKAPDGKMRETDVADVLGLLRFKYNRKKIEENIIFAIRWWVV